MKVLLIGGTGNISASCARLCVARGMEVFLLNRGRREVAIDGARVLLAAARDPAAVAAALGDLRFDAVADFVAFTPEDVECDAAAFAGRTRQYLFISSASCYQKPLPHPFVTESTPLRNPFWEYSRNKIACEDALSAAYRNEGFPAVIVRPSHTYDRTKLPCAGGYTSVARMRAGKPVVVHGDGFGQRPGTRHMRIVFLPPEEVLEEAFNRLESFMKNRTSRKAGGGLLVLPV